MDFNDTMFRENMYIILFRFLKNILKKKILGVLLSNAGVAITGFYNNVTLQMGK